MFCAESYIEFEGFRKMSYARWGNSSWYIFWNAYGGASKNSQVLSIWLDMDNMYSFSYEELINWTYHTVMEKYGVSKKDALYCIQKITEWIKDVDEESDEFYEKEYNELVKSLTLS